MLKEYYFRAYFKNSEDGGGLMTVAESEEEARDILKHDHNGIIELIYEYEKDYE